MKNVIVVLGLLALGCPGPASAETKKDKAVRSALADFEAVWRPIGQATGATRTDQACASADKLKAAGESIPQDHSIKTSAVDNVTWGAAVGELQMSLEVLPRVCKAPERKLKGIGGSVQTGDQVVADIDDSLRALLDEAQPRDLPKPLKTFRTTWESIHGTGKALCTKRDQLAKLVAGLAVPANADATKWQAAQAKLTSTLDELKKFACGTPLGADDEISSCEVEVHDAYYQLVLLVPPHAP